jgi:hypothetical protein
MTRPGRMVGGIAVLVCVALPFGSPSPAAGQFVHSTQWEVLARSRINAPGHYAAGIVDALGALNLVRESGPDALFALLPFGVRRLRTMSVDDVRALASQELASVESPGFGVVRRLAKGAGIDLPAQAHPHAVIGKVRWNLDGLTPILQYAYAAGVADGIWALDDLYRRSGSEATLSLLLTGVRCSESLTLWTIDTFTDQVKKTAAPADEPAVAILSALGDCRALPPAAPSPSTMGPPARADVTSTIQRTGAQVGVALRIVIPAGDAQQAVKVVVIGPDGSAKTVYERVHAPGETVTASASGAPPFIVQVYVAGVLAKQVTVPVDASPPAP